MNADDALLAELATRLWRSRRLSGRLDPPPRPLTRELEAALDRLAEAGVVVQDHDGTDFDSGQSLVAVAFQPVPGTTRDRVLETLRPSVYRDGRHVQRGEVVVAVPAAPDQSDPSDPSRENEIEEPSG